VYYSWLLTGFRPTYLRYASDFVQFIVFSELLTVCRIVVSKSCLFAMGSALFSRLSESQRLAAAKHKSLINLNRALEEVDNSRLNYHLQLSLYYNILLLLYCTLYDTKTNLYSSDKMSK